HSHFLWLGVAGHEVGFDTLLMYTWRDREIVMDLLADITGNRVNYGINTIGGVRRDLSREQLAATLKGIDLLEERVKYYAGLITEDSSLIARLSRVGQLSHEDAIRLGAVGPTARASKVDRDVRRDDPYCAYPELQFKVITDDHSDVYGRAVVRIMELLESCSLVRQIIRNMPDGPLTVKAPRRIPAGEALSRYEAPRGEDVHFVKGNGTDQPERVKIRAPTMANLQAVSKMLENGYLADVPIVIAAIDPCFSCTDRAIGVVDLANGRKGTTDWASLRKYSIDWYRNRGVNFGERT
ncbi:MAG: NADH dehydrogenase subunit, partial [Candidatus Riflebacteria bacterium]|nr:NADH dehydrogenase subunit [Candidatus Riflebacteria bacterium]